MKFYRQVTLLTLIVGYHRNMCSNFGDETCGRTDRYDFSIM